MAVEKLSSIHALKPGSQVWILPEKSVSTWASQLDWHMNFLISKSETRERKRTDAELNKTMASEEINIDLKLKANYDTTLLATSDFFPNICTIIIKNYKSPDQWLEKILEVQESLNPKTLRIFLPKSCDAQTFIKASKKNLEDMAITLVEDQ